MECVNNQLTCYIYKKFNAYFWVKETGMMSQYLEESACYTVNPALWVVAQYRVPVFKSKIWMKNKSIFIRRIEHGDKRFFEL